MRTGHDLDDEWQEAAFLGGWHVHATAEEMRALGRLMFEELDKVRKPRDERPDDARAVYITFRALVQPDRD